MSSLIPKTMPKFGSKFHAPTLGKKTKTKKSSKKEKVSPLMADDDEPIGSSSSRSNRSESSRAGKDDKRKAEREERRKKREGRLADSEESKASSKSKKKSKPKLSQAERDVEDSQLSRCHRFGQFMVKFVHLIDGAIGLTFVVYGSLIMTQFENPAMEAVITCLTFGSVLLFAAIMGTIGFLSSVCKRVGLAISGYTAPLIAVFYIFVIIALLSSPLTYFMYLTDNKDVLYLNDAEIAILTQILPFFYIVMAALTAVETFRFFTLRKIRHTLVKFDAASKRVTASARSSASASASGSSRSSKKASLSRSSKRSSKSTNLTEPLIEKDEELGEGSSDEDNDW